MADIHGLYAITDPQLLPQHKLLPCAEAALRGGARLLQYRDKQASAALKHENAQALLALCNRYGALFVVNDDPELAAQVSAHAVHIGQSDGGLAKARRTLPHGIVGVTCHGDLALAQQAIDGGASYVAFGRFFPSHTKPAAPAAAVAILQADLPVPKVAIGGITLDNAQSLIAAGADSLAVIHALFHSADPRTIERTARNFSALFN